MTSQNRTVAPRRSKPSPALAWVFVLTTAAYAITASLFFAGGRAVSGAIWTVGSVLFGIATVMRFKMYRRQLQTWRRWNS